MELASKVNVAHTCEGDTERESTAAGGEAVPPLGRVCGEDIDYYHHCGAISSTMFRTYLRSPREYWLRYVLGVAGEESPSDALAFGRVAHGVILNGEEYVPLPAGLDRRTKVGREEYDRILCESGPPRASGGQFSHPPIHGGIRYRAK